MIIKSKMTIKKRKDINITSLMQKKEKIKRARNLSVLEQYENNSGRTSKMVD
jgi:hypothetical protein